MSDIILPGATGPQIVAHLRQHRPRLKALFVSGYSELPDDGAPNAAGKLRILEKPFSSAKLLRAVRAELA